jgi:hypothetical protein
MSSVPAKKMKKTLHLLGNVGLDLQRIRSLTPHN